MYDSTEIRQPSDVLTDDWRSRGYLPHVDQPGMDQFVTFRLADSLPKTVLARWSDDDGQNPVVRFHERERALDEGHGSCWLARPDIANMVEGALLHFDARRYHLLAWVVMPNHVHALVKLVAGTQLSGVVRSWKSYTARCANRLLGRSGAFWYPDYYDRFIRNDEHLRAVVDYIHRNPVSAGLVSRRRAWEWSSARRLPPAQLR